MRQRGRKSPASLSIVPTVGDERQPAPEILPPEARPIWDEVIRSRRAGWFDGCLHLLEIYVRAIHLDRSFAAQLAEAEPKSPLALELARCLRSQDSLVSNLATRLRLTPRTLVDRNAAPKIVPPGPRPWELPA